MAGDYQERFMRRALELSRSALAEAGSMPFGAVVVRDGAIVGEGLNRSIALSDPTSHAEVEAIRDACRRLRCLDLSGCDLYSSCELCPICVSTMEAVGIGRLFYGATLDDSRQALAGADTGGRRFMNIDAWRAEVAKPSGARRVPAEQNLSEEAKATLRDWAAAHPAAASRRS